MGDRCRRVLAFGGAALLIGAAPADPLAPLPERPRPAAQLLPPAPVRQLVTASPVSSGFEAYKAYLAARAANSGISQAVIRSTIPSLTLSSRVIQLDRAQPGGVANPNAVPPFAPYRRRHVSADLISRGRAIYAAHASTLNAIETRTGVRASIALAIFGHETSYGRVTGNFDLLTALATLAYEGRRRTFFEDEFIAALRLIDRGVPRSRLRGSWAGATGYPQFMPTSVLRLRTDGDGDGRADIWTSRVDALASIAVYLREAGWKPGLDWGIPVRVPDSLDRASLRSTSVAPKCPQVHARHSRWLTMAEWRARGVQPLRRSLRESDLATLIEPDGRGATAYLLTSNYRALLDYNCSNFYALSVGVLADSIVGR